MFGEAQKLLKKVVATSVIKRANCKEHPVLSVLSCCNLTDLSPYHSIFLKSPQFSMSQQGANLSLNVEGRSSGEARSTSSGSVSSSAKAVVEISKTISKSINPVISQPQEAGGTHNGTTSASDPLPAVVDLAATVGFNSSSGSVKIAGANSSSDSIKMEDEGINDNLKLTSPFMDDASKNNTMPNPTSLGVVHASETNTTGPNQSSMVVVHGVVESNKGEGKDQGGSDHTARSSNSKMIRSSSSSDVQVDVKDAPKPVTTTGCSNGSNKGKGKGIGKVALMEVDHVVHIWTERERRKKMKSMYNILQSLLPRLPDKADHATIVGEAVGYIKTLEGTIQRLQKLKMERMRDQQLGSGSSSMASAPPPVRHGPPVPATREVALADMVKNLSAQQAVAMGSTPLPHGPFHTWSTPNIVLSVIGNNAFINMSTPRKPCVLTKVLYVLEKYHIDIVTMEISSYQNQSLFYIHTSIDATSTCLTENMMMMAEGRYKMAVAEMLQLIAN